MALRVAWSPRVATDLESIVEYISKDSPAYARGLARKVLDATRRLSRFPLHGRKVPEFNDEEIREILVSSYRVIYEVQDRRILVTAVIHGKRTLP